MCILLAVLGFGLGLGLETKSLDLGLQKNVLVSILTKTSLHHPIVVI